MLPTFVLSSKAYAVLKWMTLVLLPASGTAYLAAAELMDWSNGPTVASAIVIFTTFLGTILGISAKNYNAQDVEFDGDMIVEQDPVDGHTVARLEFKEQPEGEQLRRLDSVKFKVVIAE